jgi:hypothetical protein
VISLALAGILAVGALAAPAAETKRRPAVVVTSEDPVVVAGRGFVPRERVVLRVLVGSHAYSKQLRATALGTFRATFAEADAECHPFSVTALGGAGSRATQVRRITIPPPCGIDPQR